MPRKKTGAPGWVASGLAWGIAGGIALGALVVAPSMAPIADNSFNQIAGSSSENGGGKKGAAVSEESQRQVDAANALLANSSTAIVQGALEQRPFMIIRTPDANADDVDVTSWLAKQAGGLASGQITLTDKFLSSDGADELRSIIATTLPAGAQLSVDNQAPGVHAGESLGAALMFDPKGDQPLATVEDRAVVLQALRDAGFIEYEDGTITPVQGIILITGGSTDEEEAKDGGSASDEGNAYSATVLADFARALDSKGDAVVLAGRRGAAADKGSLAQLRADEKSKVSTVDSLDSETGRISTVLALAEQIGGGSGAYGSASNANADMPAPKLVPRREG